MLREAWVTETQEAFLVEKGRAEKVALAEAELECVPVVPGSAVAGLVWPFGEGLLSDYG